MRPGDFKKSVWSRRCPHDKNGEYTGIDMHFHHCDECEREYVNYALKTVAILGCIGVFLGCIGLYFGINKIIET